MSDYEFGSLDLQELSEEGGRLNAEPTEGGGQTNYLDNYVQMPKSNGSVNLRLLPPAKGGKLYQYTRLIGINGRNVHCPKPLINGKWDKNTPNVIGDYYSHLWKQIEVLEKDGGSKDLIEKLKAEARSIKPVERYYYNVIVRTSVDKEGNTIKNAGPKILSVGKTLHKIILSAIVPGSPDFIGNVVDLEKGYDFVIRKEVVGSGSNAYPKYDRSAFSREQTPAGTPEEIKKWVTTLHDLTTLRKPASAETLEYELAVHRGLIKDSKATGNGFDPATFDAKYGKTTTVATTSVETVEAPKQEDTSINNEEFDAELAALKESMGQ